MKKDGLKQAEDSMKNTTGEIRYFAYCRKSTEDSTRQVASINDQVKAVLDIAKREELILVCKPFTEERSSKEPGRPIFNEMLDRIEKGEADGIICWDIDRLYRNPVDEGRMRWMLQKGVIRAIVTPSRKFFPDDAGLLMGVEGGRATDYVIRLAKNVKRGFKGKLERGWRPGVAPIGYMNIGEEGNKEIIPDPQSFDIIRKMWDLFLTGTYSVSKIQNITNNEWGLRTRTRRKLGGKPLSMSHMYTIFNNPFYYGSFWWKDPETGEKRIYPGKHQPMITESEYRRAQILLGKKGKPQPKTRAFPFTGIMYCDECNSMITAEEKNQIICSECRYKFAYENKTACPNCKIDISEMQNQTILNYVYYHCTKKKNRKCAQKSIRVEDLEKQFNKKLESLKIDSDYLSLALDYLKNTEGLEINTEKTTQKSLEAALAKCEERLLRLNNEYTSSQNLDYSIYTPEEFKKYKKDILSERANIEQQIQQSRIKVDRTLELSERTFNFCAYAQHHFNNGDIQKRREIFSSIGSNLTLKDKKLQIELLYPYLVIANEVASQKRLYSDLGLVNKAKSDTLGVGLRQSSGHPHGTPESPFFRDAAVTASGLSAGESLEPRTKVRTSKNPHPISRFEDFDPKSRDFLPGLDSNQGPSR